MGPPLRQKTVSGRWLGKLRAQWPGRKLGTHSNFARRKRCTPSQECVPRNGVRGKRPMDLGGAKRSRSPSDASPGAFCLLCRHGQSRSPPAGGEISPCGERNRSIIAPSSAPVCALGHLPPGGKAYGRLIAAPTREKGGEIPSKKQEEIPAVPGKEQRGLNLRKTEKRLLLVRGFLSPGNSQAQLIQLLVVRPQNAGILWGPVGIKMLGRNEFALRQGFALAGKTLVRRIRAAPSAMGPLRGRPGNVTPPRRSPLSG